MGGLGSYLTQVNRLRGDDTSHYLRSKVRVFITEKGKPLDAQG